MYAPAFHHSPKIPIFVQHSSLQHRAHVSTNSSVGSNWKSWHGFRKHLLRLWRPLPTGVGLVLLVLLRWRYIRQKDPSSDSKTADVAKGWEITCYRAVPLRMLSRIWGWITNKQLPLSVRPFVYNYYASTFGCNLQEAAYEDLTSYKSLAEFFCRPLKDGVRPIDKIDCIVSPADGHVISFGPVDTCKVEQVKGVTYSLQQFLGDPTWSSKLSHSYADHDTDTLTASDYKQSLLLNKDTALYQCVVYLAPGDYHRFHSPVNWDVTFRRHFQGELLSVNPKVAQWIPDLFTLNERAVYVGRWKHGFFSLTAVGATNVGSIHVYCDKGLVTNQRKWQMMKSRHKDSFLVDMQGETVEMRKGQPFGEFRLGSTVVLLFEAPKDYKFKLRTGQRILVGEGVSECHVE
ncbi:phosphatidylserine decarboxylase proenzyme, mitochondrial isoform X2 [Zootermopsis nevadensis]|nr:phosphatidylserine decarboxylase proenzyme, mitochondrial isoform X2 [Zootermopsis nevadensis]XP_021927862.1 phosphatidylserine decarboxylase proenzyme, mitochondrial isoform X2 [Zootermopsis nevadensis]XP_021927863.1 phosphatidylserine decarboxylase proenzyme, mitochondrial isoform X2 [Zootermopsis nevadensis]XP_021927865.1 phosphatidylserine decarboxylase proenzyme, mitochondrial isoform X2 [Zootermopsis nevadensis]